MLRRFGMFGAIVVAIVIGGPGTAVATATAAGHESACSECCSDETVCTIVAELQDLSATVDELVPDAGRANSFDAKVNAATRSVLAGRYGTALNQLDAFGNEVDAMARSDPSSAPVSNVLKTRNDSVKNSIANVR